MDSVDGALRFLQRSFASIENEEAKWKDERTKLEQQVRELQAQKLEQEEAHKAALLRVKMLEFALKQERKRYLESSTSVSVPVRNQRSMSHAVSSRVVEVASGGRRASGTTSNSPPNSALGSRPLLSNYKVESNNPLIVGSDKLAPNSTDLRRQRVSSRTQSGTTAQEGEAIIPPRKQTSSKPNTVGTSDEVLIAPRNGPNRSPTLSQEEIVIPPRKAQPRTASNSTISSNMNSCTNATSTPAAVDPQPSFRPPSLKIKCIGHLDSVRAVAFHPTEPILVSGSEDCTVKVWQLANVTNSPPSHRINELDAVLTTRTHTKEVLSVAVIASENYATNTHSANAAGAFATAGRDGSICLFNLPTFESDERSADPLTFEEYGRLKGHTMKSAHNDAIWDLHAHPLTNILFSASADGTVRTWNISSELKLTNELQCTTQNHGRAVLGHNSRGVLVPTTVHTLMTDSKTCVVGYTSGSIAHFDYGSEQLLNVLNPADCDALAMSSNTRDAQVNKLVTHPTMPIVLAAHQDKKVRIYDLRAGSCVSTFVAHQDAVSCISVNSAGITFATGSHDGSLRLWSVAERKCLFEQAVHRSKLGEAVHSVAFHQTRGIIATGGADSGLKIFQ